MYYPKKGLIYLLKVKKKKRGERLKVKIKKPPTKSDKIHRLTT
jgi:hypothetical protein